MPGHGPFRDGEVRLGRVVGAFGIRGELRVFLYNRDSELLWGGAEVELVAPDGRRRRGRIALRPGAGRRIIARFDGVDDRPEAEGLLGWEIVVPREALPPLEEGEYYHRDLLGLRVRTDAGRELGRLAEIWSAEVDTWIVRGGGREYWVPALREAILEVDLERGEVLVADDRVGEP